MAASGSGRPRRGPAPIASFDHDVSEESSPETKQSIRLPEIREDPHSSKSSVAAVGAGDSLAPPEQRARSHSSPAVHAAAAPAALHAPPAPRIDISRASSSSHHDSRDSSPELALFAGGEDSKTRLELGFREDGALELRSSTEELAFLEGAPGGPEPKVPAVPPSRRHSRKDSQGSEAALLAVSGRTSRLSSVGSQCSAHSVLSGFSHTSRVSRLSVVSGVSRSPSPHKMILETSFCGPKPIETDPDICAAAVEERLLEIAKLSTETMTSVTVTQPSFTFATTVDARDRREVRTEATVENTRPVSVTRVATAGPQPLVSVTPTPPVASVTSPMSSIVILDDDKRLKETRNRARAEENRSKSKDRRDTSQPEVYKSSNRTKNIIRIKLKPDDEYDDDDDDTSEHTLVGGESARKPASLELTESSTNPVETVSPQLTPRRPRDSRTPSPTGAPTSRKSSFCSLFKSRETIASPDSPSDVLRRKKSLNEGRSRSKSRDRSGTSSASGKIKGSVLSLFKTPRRSNTSPSPSSRDVSPVVQQQRQFPQPSGDRIKGGEKLKYYEDSKDGIIHIPLRTPPDELDKKEEKCERITKPETSRPSSAPQVRAPERTAPVAPPKKPTQRTVLPDGSIIIPLHSPTEKTSPDVTEAKSEIEPEKPTSVVNAKKQQNGCATLRNTESETDIHRNQEISRVYSSESDTTVKNDRPKKKERIIFSTHVGSREQVFSTQFSITKTPSVTSEISESIPSFQENEEVRINDIPLEVTNASEPERITNDISTRQEETFGEEIQRGLADRRESSSSEGSLEGGVAEVTASEETAGGSEGERRGLVVQESFEELPYVPTTLPQERSVALPMVPVRERAAPPLVAVRRPRAAAPPAPLAARTPPAPAPAPAPAPPARLHIRLPARARAVSAAGPPPPPRRSRPRSRSGGDGVEVRGKADWVDFSEMPEWRMEPKRIEMLPKSGAGPKVSRGEGVEEDLERVEGPEGVVFSYVPPERCRCECHAHTEPLAEPLAERAPDPCDDEMPLLDDSIHKRHSSSSLEYEEERAPFTADLDLRANHSDLKPAVSHNNKLYKYLQRACGSGPLCDGEQPMCEGPQ